MSPSSNRREPVLNVNDYSARYYPPGNSQRPDSSDFPMYNFYRDRFVCGLIVVRIM